jgi:arylsulfatase A-like enzyme
MEPIVRFVDECQKSKTPFFVWYAPMMPHDPHTPPDRLFDKYKDKTESIHVARYWAMIEWFDETVGQLMTTLRERNLEENTLVVYVADNGWIQSTDNPRYAPKSKQSQFDGGLRTPILVRWPGKVAPKMSDQLAQSIDFFPTILRAVGISEDSTPPGINLLDEKQVNARSTIYGTCYTHNAVDLNEPSKNVRWRWMIDGKTKLIVPNPINEPAEQVALYDLEEDPTEEANIANANTEKVLALQSKLDAWWKP